MTSMIVHRVCWRNSWILNWMRGYALHEANSIQKAVKYVSSAPPKSSESSAFSISSSALALKTLQNFGVQNPKLLQKIKNTPGVSGVDPNAWKNVLQTLGQYGLNPDASAAIVFKNPKLLTFSQEKLSQCWTNWLVCCHQNELVRNLVMLYPKFLNLDRDDIRRRYNHIKAVIGSPKFSIEVLMRCPQIMFRSLKDLQEVSDYISEEMVVRNVSEYYKSTALGYTLQEIKTRHVFLERCGKYKTPNLKQSDKIRSKNPTLMDICDTSAEDFATKVAGLTWEEFVVFQSLYDEELKNLSEIDDESDEDSE